MVLETVLVIGGTGMLGVPVVRRLAADGHTVKVLSRNKLKAEALFFSDDDDDNNNNNTNLLTKNITVVEGDINNPQSLQRAMENCTCIHINLSSSSSSSSSSGSSGSFSNTDEAHGTLQVIKAAQEYAATVTATTATGTGKEEIKGIIIKRISFTSGVTTCKENCWYEGTKAKLQAEKYIIQSGFDYTIFRCTIFLETLPKWKFLISTSKSKSESKSESRGTIITEQQQQQWESSSAAATTTRWHWLAAKDYARMVSNSFNTISNNNNNNNNATRNKIFFIYGPGPPCTIQEAVNNFFIPICEPSRGPIPVLSLEELQQTTEVIIDPNNTSSSSTTTTISEKMIAKLQWLDRVKELGSPTEANQILGTPSVTIQQWCQEYLFNKKNNKKQQQQQMNKRKL